MAGEEDIQFRMTADGSPARREINSVYELLRKLNPAANAAGKSLDDMGSGGIRSLREYATTIERVDALLDNLETRQARNASRRTVATNTTALSNSNTSTGIQTGASRAALASQNALNAAVRGEVMQREQANRNLIAESRQTLIAAQTSQVANRQRIDSIREAARQERQLAQERARADRAAQQAIQAQRTAQEAAWRSERSNALARERQAANPAVAAGTERTSALASQRASSVHDVDQINATRYALYDVAQTATIVGTAIAGVGGAAVLAATQAEASFANVRRAMDATATEAEPLRKSLLDLTTSMPTSFTDVAGVAQLGAQLGIANTDLDNFSESVVKFSATTNVSTEAAGTAFGRLSQLLKVPAAEFENLSSSIYQVGITSVATESEIINTSTQIAGAAAAYNFTAEQVVGLSGAFASLGVAPEAARGSVTRIFGDIEKAVSAGGAELQPFADLLHTTTDNAAMLWKTDPSQFFSKLVDGLSHSNDLLSDLSSIGAKDVRDVNLLQRLAKNSDFLADSLKTAKDAYEDGTATSKGYEVTAATVQAKVKELVNTFTKLGIAAGGPLLAGIGGALDLLKNFINALSNGNPIVLAIIATLTLLVGGFILLKGAQAAAMAGILALRFVLQQLGQTGGVTGLNMASLRTQIALLRTEMVGTTSASAAAAAGVTGAGTAAATSRLSMLNMGTVMRGIGWSVAIAGALQLASSLIQTGLNSKYAAEGLQNIQKATYTVSPDKLVNSFKTANDVVKQFGDQFNGRSGGLNQINAQVNSFFSQFGNATPDLTNAKNEIAAIDSQLSQIVGQGNAKAAAQAISDMGLSAAQARDMFPSYTSALKTAEDAARAQGGAAGNAALENDSLTDSTTKASGSLDNLFNSLTGGDYATAVQTLFSGIYDAGASFNYLSESGRANLQNLQGAMEQTAAYGATLGQSSTTSIALLFQNLQKQGVDTAALLQQLASVPVQFRGDIDVSAIQKKLAALMGGGGAPKPGGKGFSGFTDLSSSLDSLSVLAPKAANGLSGVGKAAKKSGKDAKDAAKEVKTLGDYVSDLSGVFNDARQYRFGVTDALDDISTKWKTIQDGIKDANKAVQDHKDDIADARRTLAGYRADLQGLQAQLSGQRYFLRIAVQYGDTNRATAIRADMADINSQIASKQADINKAQKDATAPYDGTTKSIIDQRQSLGELAQAYQKAVEEYARSGLSQAQLSQKTEQLRQDFVRQATQAGYSRAEIDKYSKSFEDLTYIINHVPRKITVSANMNPAIQALNDFLAKANKAKATPSIDSPGAGAAGLRAAQAFSSNFDAWFANWQNSFNGTKKAIDQITKDIAKIKIPDLSHLGRDLGFQVGGARGMFTPGKNAFPIGGFVPGSAPSDRRVDNMRGLVAGGGIVGLQGGEPIMTNAARSKYGDEMFNQINSLRFKPQMIQPKVVVQGGNTGYTELSPTDRAYLADIARNIGISIASSALEKAVGAGNAASSRRRAG